MDNVNFGAGASDAIENALMDLGPLLGVTIKEEVPEETTQTLPPNNVPAEAPSVAGGSGVAKAEEVDSATDAAGDARCVFCKVALVGAEGTPLLMECLHSTCEACLKAKLDRDMMGVDRSAVVPCPVCKLQCSMMNMIEQRFVMEKIAADQASTQGVVAANQQCNSCEEHEAATSYCVDCAEFICASCVQAHQRLKITKDHTIKTKEEAQAELQAANGQRRNEIYCRDHPQERLALFCETCERLTCRDCQLQQHRDHRYQFSAEMAQQARANITGLLAEVSYKRVLLGSAMKVIKERQAAIAEKKRGLVHDITATVVKLTNAINTRGKQLVLRLNEVCDAKQRTLHEKKEALQQLAEVTQHCVLFAEGALGGSDTALLQSRRALLQQLQRVKARRADIPNPDVPVRIALNMDKLPDLLKVVSTIGNIVVDGKVDGGGAGHAGGAAQGPYHPPAVSAPSAPTAPAAPAMHHQQHLQMQNIHAMQSFVSGGFGGAGLPRHAHPHVSSTTHPHHLQGMSELNLRGLLNAAGGRAASPRLHHHYTHAQHLLSYSQQQQAQAAYNAARRASPRAPSPAPPPAYPAHPTHPTHPAHPAPPRWHIPQMANMGVANSELSLAGGGGVEYKIPLSRQHSVPAVTSTNPKSPSPLLNGTSPDLDAVCAESVRDLMATIAKLDSNGVQVVAERPAPTPPPGLAVAASPAGPASPASPAPPVHSSTSPHNAKPVGSLTSALPASACDPNEDWCAVCMDGGELMCCDKCPKVFHQYCHIPTIDKLPDETETWQCLLCVNFAELPPEPAQNGSGITPRQQKLMERVTLELYCQYETSLAFREPVNRENIDYYSKIASPMCLDQIRMKLQPRSELRYSSVQQFVADCRLLFHNAATYNPPDSQIYKDAKRLEEFFDAQLEKWFPEYLYYGPDGEPANKRLRN